MVFVLVLLAPLLQIQAQPSGTAIIDIITVTTPGPFAPTIPTLDPDDSSVSYIYLYDGTGYWSGLNTDDDGYVIGLETAVLERTSHNKINHTSVQSSKSSQLDLWLEYDYCTGLYTYYSNYDTCMSTTNTMCDAGADWYEASGGEGPGGGLPWDNDIVEYTNYDLGCGTLTFGGSFFATTFGSYIGSCSIVPTSYFTGKGMLYEINLTLTTNCTPNPIPPNMGFNTAELPPSVSFFTSSDGSSGAEAGNFFNSTMTPSAGFFTNNNSFHFCFNTSGSTNDHYGVYSSTDLVSWAYLGTVTSSNTAASFVDTAASNYSQCFYIVTSNQLACSSAYGFVNLAIPSGTSMIANPLLTQNMDIGTLITNIPNGTTLQFWAQTNWGPTTTYSSGSWDHPYWSLSAGNGALINASSNTTITFVGQVLDGYITNMIPPGFSVRSSAFPLATDIGTLGLTGLTNGDFIQEWNGTNYTTYTNVAGSWVPSTPTLTAGQSFIVYSGLGTSWGAQYVSADVYALSKPIISNVSITDDYYSFTYTIGFGWDKTGWPFRERPATAPNGAMYELQEYDGGGIDNDSMAPVTDSSLVAGLAEAEITFPPWGPGGQHDYLRLRYTNGRIVGPWSDLVDNESF